VARKDPQVVQSGERTNTDGKPVSNIILLSISDSDYSSLRPHLEYVSLPNHLVLHEAGGTLEFAYFPNRGLISLVVVMKDGKTAEAGIVGNEGFTGTLDSTSEMAERNASTGILLRGTDRRTSRPQAAPKRLLAARPERGAFRLSQSVGHKALQIEHRKLVREANTWVERRSPSPRLPDATAESWTEFFRPTRTPANPLFTATIRSSTASRQLPRGCLHKELAAATEGCAFCHSTEKQISRAQTRALPMTTTQTKDLAGHYCRVVIPVSTCLSRSVAGSDNS